MKEFAIHIIIIIIIIIIPGRKPYRQCEKILEASKEIANSEEDHSDLYMLPIEEKEDLFKKSFDIIGQSPVKKKKGQG